MLKCPHILTIKPKTEKTEKKKKKTLLRLGIYKLTATSKYL